MENALAMNKKADSRYMMRRSLGLLLSDARHLPTRGDHIEFSLDSKPMSGFDIGARLPCLVLLLNLTISLRALSKVVLPELSVPSIWIKERQPVANVIRGRVNWAETFQRRQQGVKGYVVENRGRHVAEHQARYIAVVLEEILMHCGIIIDHVRESVSAKVCPEVWAILAEVEGSAAKTSSYFNEHYHFFAGSADSLLAAAKEVLRAIIHGEIEGGNPLEYYREKIDPEIPPCALAYSPIEALDTWRRQYLGCRVWLGANKEFFYRRKARLPQLYELWTFCEIVFAAKRLGMGDTVQRAFLSQRRLQPEFLFGFNHYVYFDYRTSKFLSASVESLCDGSIRSTIPGVFVEWFIRNRISYEKSVVLDCKYANWNSREALKVWGYANNFSVENAALIIRGDLPGSISANEIVPGLYKFIPGGRSKITLWALSLRPDVEAEGSNRAALEGFLNEIFV